MKVWRDFVVIALLASLNGYAAHGLAAKLAFSAAMLTAVLAAAYCLLKDK